MKHYSHWDEYQWENEIRRHENNVASFFQDLVYCLDLPIGDVQTGLSGGPAEMPSDPVSTRQNDALRQWMSDHGEDEECDEQNNDAEPRRPVCFSCVDALDQLAAEWNQFAVNAPVSEVFVFFLGINCAFAKLLARTADFTEPGKSDFLPLQITLGKRAIDDLEELVDRLNSCKQAFPNIPHFDYFIQRLALVRDQLVEKLNTLRRQA